MALIRDKNGIVDLTGRSWLFQSGHEINPGYESFLKDIERQSEDGRIIKIDYDYIERVFSPIIDAWGGMVYQNSYERFFLYCEARNLQCVKDERTVSIRKNPRASTACSFFPSTLILI